MESNVLAQAQKRGHEQIVFFNYPQFGLKAIVGIHNTVLGPALGGCRMRIYQNEAQALDDVLRLSEGMTYKSSIAGLDLGGGKSIIIADPALEEGRRDLFLQFGRCMNHLQGRYITAEDMGTSVADVMIMREVSKYAAGFDPAQGGGGDPSPWTARGVYNSIVAACERRFGSKDLSGRTVALQGVGHVGMYLLKMLRKAKVKVTVCDTKQSLVDQAQREFGAEVVNPDSIYDIDCDIYAPCAMGQTVNANTLKRLKCGIIAGAANNQLSGPEVYKTIAERKMLYCPDFVINSGGVICVGGEFVEGGWNENWVTKKVENIYNTIHKILDESEKKSQFPEIVALELAKERIRETEERKRAKAR